MLLDSLNLNHLRVFECVYRHQNMTEAAKELHMTQSGVSQHIKSLEDMLEVSLFDRLRKRLVPTNGAHVLFRKCSAGLQEIESGLHEIKDREQKLAGTVTLGVPAEFGTSVVVPLLAKFSAKYPDVRFRCRQGLAPAMSELLLRGELDFAVVDAFAMDRRIALKRIYDEILGLYISEEALKKRPKLPSAQKEALAWFEHLDYVDYQDDGDVLRMWFKHHFKAARVKLRIRAAISDVQAVARMIESGMGAGILPDHVVEKIRRAGPRLHCFKGSGEPLKNSIRLATLDGRSQSPAAAAAIKWLSDSLARSH